MSKFVRILFRKFQSRTDLGLLEAWRRLESYLESFKVDLPYVVVVDIRQLESYLESFKGGNHTKYELKKPQLESYLESFKGIPISRELNPE